jgi:hypothetical protein
VQKFLSLFHKPEISVKNKWMVSMPWNIDKRLFKLELSFEKRKIGGASFPDPCYRSETKLRQLAE